jgi:hypothetical protein
MSSELKALAQSYVEAVQDRGGAPARLSLLREVVSDSVRYSDPLGQAQGVDELLAELEAQTRVFPGLRAERIFADEGDICVVFGSESSGVLVDVLKIQGGRIDRISRVFDARPLQKLRAEI